MISLATILDLAKKLEAMYPGISLEGMTPDSIVSMWNSCGHSAPAYACEKADEALGKGASEALKKALKEDREISFGRDGVSFISFKESSLSGIPEAVRLAKYMKLLMVEYKLTSQKAAFVLFNVRTAGVCACQAGGWGKYLVKNARRFNFAHERLQSYILKTIACNASILLNFEAKVESISL